MKLKEEMKQVEYFGIQLLIPEIHKFIAVDEDGELFSFSVRPIYRREHWDFDANGSYFHITNVDLEGLDWRETLKEV